MIAGTPTTSDGDGGAAGDPRLLAAMQDAEVYFGFGLPRPLFLAAKRLRWVQSASAGVASLLYPEMLASDVTITNSAVIMGDPIAEQALSGIFYFVRNLDIAVDQQRRSEWNKTPFVSDPSMARELSECRAADCRHRRHWIGPGSPPHGTRLPLRWREAPRRPARA